MMCALPVVARRTLAYLFPSTPPVLAADAQTATQTPAHGPAGEGSPWVGQTPEGEDAPASVVAVEATKTPSPSGPHQAVIA